MRKRRASFMVIGLLFVIIGLTLVEDNTYLKYGFLLLGIAFLFYNLFNSIRKK